jgi:hypothetical protein
MEKLGSSKVLEISRSDNEAVFMRRKRCQSPPDQPFSPCM